MSASDSPESVMMTKKDFEDVYAEGAGEAGASSCKERR